ncbi:MAG: protein-glutamate methylesterase/protein-glutamine glutaminase [Inquilinaceae bacterium]
MAAGMKAAGAGASGPIQVMVVDDSAVIRGLISRTLEEDPAIRVVTSVSNGELAIGAIARHAVDVVVLDIEMPVMDGLTALPKLIAASPRTKIIMASTLTKKNAEVSLAALAAGAADYVSKPSTNQEINSGNDFKAELTAKVKALGAVARGRGPTVPVVAAAPQRQSMVVGTGPIRTRPMPTVFNPEIIAIGSSTGGPKALLDVMRLIGPGLRQPIIVTQHMPPTFTTILAEHISKQCGVPTSEGIDGEPLVGGRCYVAPGDFHMTVERKGTGNVIRLSKGPRESFCRPAVDPMLRSAVALFGRNVLVAILTGMGQDGMLGCQKVAGVNGVVLAQDEATSVVWGMPGAVAHAGVCNAIMPIAEIGPAIRRLALRAAA